MNHYPLWKNLMILAVILTAAFYALPNIYGQDPSIEISPTSRTGEVTAGTVGQVESILKQRGLVIKRIDIETGKIRVRFKDGSTQLKAKEALEEKLQDEYALALNLSPDVPAWLQGLGAKPMSLGLDLRGGIHVLIDVDMEAEKIWTTTSLKSSRTQVPSLSPSALVVESFLLRSSASIASARPWTCRVERPLMMTK